MRTIGSIIKEARLHKKISLSHLENETKIKREFLESIERQDWGHLPDLPVVTGFVKNIARILALNENQIMAMLRRDYPPRRLVINPKKDVSDRFSWTPKLTFLVGAAAFAIFILGYLIFQYAKFVTPPTLNITRPKEGAEVTTNEVKVEGVTDPNATVKVNNQPVLVNEDGSFIVGIAVYEGTTKIVVKAISRTGKESVVTRNIKVTP